MRRWPDILPGPSALGYKLTPVDQSLRTDMETGSQRLRRLTTERLDRASITLVLSDAEMTAFRAFHADAYWSAAGDSDDLTLWTVNGTTINDDAYVGPGGCLADKIEEDLTNASHTAQVLLTDLAIDGLTITGWATIRGQGRNYARVSIVGRDDVVRYVEVHLTDGEVTDSSDASATTKAREADDFWRVEITAAGGTGSSTPRLRVQPMSDATTTSYLGDGSGLFVCEICAREDTGGFLRTDADGNVLGAAGGSAWFDFPVAVGGGLTYSECRFVGPYDAQASAGLIWTVAFTLEVRNA